ncbi:MAG: ABC transporter permease [Ardenticatenaceae bacterium]
MQIDLKPSSEAANSINIHLQPVSAWAVFKATVIKDLLIAKRYLPNLIGYLVQLAIRMLFFLLLSTIIDVDVKEVVGRNLNNTDLFIFIQGALLLLVFNRTGLWTPLAAVSRDLYNGTLEFLYSNPSSRYAYYAGTVAAEAVISMVAFLPLYLILVLLSAVDLINMLMILLVCATVLMALIAMGIMIGLLGLLWRQVDSIAGIIAISLEFLAGAYFPVAAFPEPIQYLAYLLPHTWGYDLVRYYSFSGEWKTIFPIWQEWAILIAFAIFFTLFSRYLLEKVEDKAKKEGLHLI